MSSCLWQGTELQYDILPTFPQTLSPSHMGTVLPLLQERDEPQWAQATLITEANAPLSIFVSSGKAEAQKVQKQLSKVA